MLGNITGTLGDVYQAVQSTATGTNYCGPFTKVPAGTPTLNETDEKCKSHDEAVGAYHHHILMGNEADRVLKRGLGEVTHFSGFRDRLTNKFARIVMGAKLGYTPFEALEAAPPDEFKTPGIVRHRSRYDPAAGREIESLRNRFARLMPMYSGTVSRGRFASQQRNLNAALSRAGVRGYRRTGRTGRRRLRRPLSKAKRRITSRRRASKKICTPQLAMAMRNAIANLQPPICQLITGKGYLANTANNERWVDPVALRMWTPTDADFGLVLAEGTNEPFTTYKMKLWIEVFYRNLSNIKVRMEVYRFVYKKKLMADSITTPLEIMGDDGLRQGPGAAEAFADQRSAWDMSQLMPDVTSESTNWPAGADTTKNPGGSQVLDVPGVLLSDFVEVHKTFHIKKIADVLLDIDQSVVLKLRAKKQTFQSPEHTTAANSITPPTVFHLHKISTMPHNSDATNALLVGNPVAAIGVIYNKHYEVRGNSSYAINRKILYIENDRTTATAFELHSSHDPEPVDRDP